MLHISTLAGSFNSWLFATAAGTAPVVAPRFDGDAAGFVLRQHLGLQRWQQGSSLMPSPDTGLSAVISTTAYANGFVIALQRVRVADVARIPQDLDTGQQFDITGRAAGLHHADAFVLVAGGVFGPVLLQRVLCRGLIGETGFLVAPENDSPARRGLATWRDLECRRPAATTARDLRSQCR